MKKNTYSMFRNVWFYSTFMHVPWYARYGMTLGALLCTVLVWYTTSYRLLCSMHTASSSMLNALQTERDKLNTAQQQKKFLEHDVTRMQAEYQRNLGALPALDFDIKNMLPVLRQHQVTLQLYAPQEKTVVRHGFLQHTVRLDVIGSYENIVACIRAFADLPAPVLFSSIHCEKYRDMLLASLQISWYQERRREDKS